MHSPSVSINVFTIKKTSRSKDNDNDNDKIKTKKNYSTERQNEQNKYFILILAKIILRQNRLNYLQSSHDRSLVTR